MVVLAGIWSVWTIYSRNDAIREANQRAKQKAAQVEIDGDRQVAEAYGGDRLTILNFAADQREVAPGGRVLICYGVNNAKRVRIEPGVEPIKPAIVHCLDVYPAKTTRYTLTAEDDKGNHESAALTIRVR